MRVLRPDDGLSTKLHSLLLRGRQLKQDVAITVDYKVYTMSFLLCPLTMTYDEPCTKACILKMGTVYPRASRPPNNYKDEFPKRCMNFGFLPVI